MKGEIRFKEDVHHEGLSLLKHCRLRLTECRIVAHHFPDKKPEMCRNAEKIVRQAIEILKLMELTE